MKKLYFLLFLLCFNTHFTHAQLELISNDFSGFYGSAETATFNGKLYLERYDSEKEQTYIWVSDGTVEGTQNFVSNFTENRSFAPTATDSHLYFIEQKPSGSKILWATNGDIVTATKIREGSNPDNRTIMGNLLFYTAVEPNGYSFWVTDGTVAGTIKLRDSSSDIFSFSFDNTIYFRDHYGFYKTDGTVTGTTLIKAFDSNFTGISLNNRFLFNNEFYFTGCDDIHGCRIWKTDGTNAGTQFVVELDTVLNTIINNPNGGNGFVLTLSGDKFLIKQQYRLYAIDTSFDVTTLSLLKDFSYGNDVSGRIYDKITLNDKILYPIQTDKYGIEYWTTDGTVSGTKVAKDIWKNASDGLRSYSRYEVELGDFMYFIGNDGIHGEELWRTDGTEEGTELVKDFTSGLADTDFSNIKAVGNQLFVFFNRDSERHFWVLNPSTYQIPTYEVPTRDADEWFINMGTNQPYDGEARNTEMKLDKDDNIFLIGNYRDVNYLEFFQDTFRLSSNPLIEERNKLFVSKFDKHGNLQWAKNIGGSGWISHNAINIDDDGNLMIAGYFEEKAVFDSTIITADNGIFLAKYSTNGDLIWVEKVLFDWAEVSKIEIDVDGNIYVAGNYRDFNISIRLNLSYIIKFDKNGNIQWGRQLSNELALSFDVTDLKIDENGNPLVLATDGILNPPNSSWIRYTELFSINADGSSERWKKQFESSGRNNVRSLVINERGDIILGGYYSGIFQLDSITLESKLMNHGFSHHTTGFIAILDKFGNVTNAFDDGERKSYFHQVIPMEGRNVGVIGGVIYEWEEVEEYEGWDLYRHKMFFSEYDGLGNLLRRKEWFQRDVYDHEDFNPSAAIDSENYLVISNTYRGQVDTFPNCFIGESGHKIYLMRTALDDDKFEIFEPEYLLNDLIVSPNPTRGEITIRMEDENWFNYQLNIFSSNGQLLYSIDKTDDNYTQEINISHLASGVLFFQFDNGTDTILKKIVKY